MTAFSPFIPHNDRDSSMPAALFAFDDRERHRRADRLHDRRPRSETMAATAACTASRNRGGLSALHFTSADIDRPPMAARRPRDHDRRRRCRARRLSLARPMVRQPEPLLARIRAARSACANDAMRSRAPTANMFQQPEHGTLARAHPRRAGRERSVRFAITWNYPLGAIYWFNRDQPGDPEYSGEPPTWRNYYATQWADSLASGADAFRRWDELEAATSAFRNSLFGSSTAARDHRRRVRHARRAAQRHRHSPRRAASSGAGRASISARAPAKAAAPMSGTTSRRSPGCSRRSSERCARPSSPTTSCRTAGSRSASACRSAPASTSSAHAPTAISARRSRPTASGGIRATTPGCAATGRTSSGSIEYAWSPDNPDRWDPDKTGVLWGRQHHTLDMELFGPNSWLTSMYLAALKAAAEMADAMGERDFAAECAALAEQGRRLRRPRALQRPLLRAEARS